MKGFAKPIAGILCLCLELTAGAAWAQSGPLIIDRNRADREPPAPEVKPPSPTGRASATTLAEPAHAFVLKAVQLEKASAPPPIINRAFQPFIGRSMDAKALGQLTDAAAAAYAQTDVALYTILLPNQTFAGGVVRMRVVEGFIQDVQIKAAGDARRDLPLVRRIANRMLKERPLRKSTLQRAVLLIRDVPGLSADVQFLRGTVPGAVVLQIELKRKPFEIGVGANNRGTAELGRTQVEVDLTANSLIRAGDQTRFTVVVPTDIDRFQYYALSHSELLTDDGLTASANIGYLRTRPASIPLHGSAETAGVALSYPLIRSNVTNLTLTGSVDGVNSDNALFGQAISDDHTRAVRVAAAYSRTFARITIAASGTASFGLDILGAEVTSPLLSDQTFKKLNARFGLDAKLTPQWTLRFRSIGQYSGDRLPAVEQMALGGDEFGRAFESAIIIGDSGAAGSAELAYSPKILPSLVKGSEVYGFIDGGKLWSQDREIIPAETQSLSSAGFGARLAVASKAMFQLEAAEALEEPLPQLHNAWRVVFGYKSIY
ncbi:MAG: ShlB/FhaC/HecB family hemolysin secretion/activation protein [Caulobacteraceae bacterium]